MDSESSHQPDSPKPKRLKTLASSVEFPGRNILLHQLVLDNSDPNESGSENYINALLMSMADAPANVVNALNGNGYTALHLAVIKNNLVMVKKLLSCLLNIDFNARTRSRWMSQTSALHLAVKVGNLSIVKELLDKGAGVDDETKDEATALVIAAHLGDLDMIKLLVSKGANVNHECYYVNPLLNAALSKNLEAVMFLINSGAAVNIITATSHTPLHAAASIKSLEIVEYLVSKGADLNARDEDRETPCYPAVYTGNLDILKFLIDRGADWRARNKSGEILLHSAVGTTLEMTSFLIDQGADVNTADFLGRTPLHHAFLYCCPKLEIVEFLISKGADLHAVDYNGKTTLHYAVRCRSLVNTSRLMDELADLDAVDEVQRRPLPETSPEAGIMSEILHDAISSARSCLDILEFSISKGADLHATDKRGSTPLHSAVIGCIAAFLLDQGADVHATDKDGWTPLHVAASENRVGVVRVLMAKGADRNARTRNAGTRNARTRNARTRNARMTPLDLARENGHQSCIDALQNVV